MRPGLIDRAKSRLASLLHASNACDRPPERSVLRGSTGCAQHRSHVPTALLLIRVAKNGAPSTPPQDFRQLPQLHSGYFPCIGGTGVHFTIALRASTEVIKTGNTVVIDRAGCGVFPATAEVRERQRRKEPCHGVRTQFSCKPSCRVFRYLVRPNRAKPYTTAPPITLNISTSAYRGMPAHRSSAR